ncbi:spore protease YyaC [Sporosarcina sp. ACRSL]|uniref:spore protease YyaC n=1 Tax=Sporosarcina sp. ACRSL TaxID=2918215 RepID=UPI001EF3FF32|nr:spore protease YyaC [Sporosarcina sp. ACRSL]MCG7345794.1 spore protease YyaC [Sporosarcina sp. ACRSL]
MHSALSTDYNFRIHYNETGAVWKLSSYFLEHIPFHEESLTFFCIGTDRSTGDALGPLTGSHLAESLLFPFPVVGTLEKPLHALNLQQQLDERLAMDPATFIVAIDACLGKSDSIGQLLFHRGPLLPGKAVGKQLPPVGDLSIKGVVNISGFMEQAVLQSTRLHIPFEMSRVISRSLQLAYGRFKTGNEQLSR